MCNQEDVTGAISHACTDSHCMGLSKCKEDAVLGLVQCERMSVGNPNGLDTFMYRREDSTTFYQT